MISLTDARTSSSGAHVANTACQTDCLAPLLRMTCEGSYSKPFSVRNLSAMAWRKDAMPTLGV